MLVKIYSAAIQGIDVKTVEIEVQVKESYEAEKKDNITVIVGLPDAAIRESRERIFTAIIESGYAPPYGRTTINLAPADLRKSGTAYDLPMAVGVVANQQPCPNEIIENCMIIGELSLDGDVRPIQGALPIAMHAKKLGLKYLILPKENAIEAAAAGGINVIGVKTFRETFSYLLKAREIEPTVIDTGALYENIYDGMPDFVDVKGQEAAKRALMVAAAGNHNVLMYGPPGTGKSMLAKRLPSIMPPLTPDESLEVTKIHSIAGVLDPRNGIIIRRPFRNPHHTVSDAGLVGGQAIPHPGELSLAHCGVLFLDELPEFRRNALEVLRQPLENGEVTLARATGTFVFPAKIMLIAAMNPCPCGYYGSRRRQCHCTAAQIASYRGRISGPLLDRIDMHVEVAYLSDEVLTAKRNGESSASMRAKVLAARRIQAERYSGLGIKDNASLSGKIMDRFCELSEECASMLKDIIEELQLSARSYDRILRVARTLADLDGGGAISPINISEAANYRTLDRHKW